MLRCHRRIEPSYALTQAEAGDNMGALLRGIKREQIRRGHVLAAPGSVKAAKKFLAQIYVGHNYDQLNPADLCNFRY